jgi:cytidylate kinase
MDSITVGGPPGAGTSTLCKLLKEELDIDYVYAGQIFRDKAREMNLSLAQFSDLCKQDPSYDHQLDNYMIDIVYIHADPKIRAERIMERDGGDLNEVFERMEDREESEARRYLDFYGIDPRERSWYDIVIDSTNISPPEELFIIIRKLQKNG